MDAQSVGLKNTFIFILPEIIKILISVDIADISLDFKLCEINLGNQDGSLQTSNLKKNLWSNSGRFNSVVIKRRFIFLLWCRWLLLVCLKLSLCASLWYYCSIIYLCFYLGGWFRWQSEVPGVLFQSERRFCPDMGQHLLITCLFQSEINSFNSFLTSSVPESGFCSGPGEGLGSRQNQGKAQGPLLAS